jgi:hypothetical protein
MNNHDVHEALEGHDSLCGSSTAIVSFVFFVSFVV